MNAIIKEALNNLKEQTVESIEYYKKRDAECSYRSYKDSIKEYKDKLKLINQELKKK
jgi:hypothetical protein